MALLPALHAARAWLLPTAPCREAAEALLRDQQGAVSGAAAGVAAAVAAMKHPDRDFGYSLTTRSALFMCRGLVASAIAGGSGGPPLHVHAHAHAAAGSSRHLSAAPSAPPGPPDPISLDRAFQLHSRPDAPHILLLDFTGAAAGVCHGMGEQAHAQRPAVPCSGERPMRSARGPAACPILSVQGTPPGARGGTLSTATARLLRRR